MDKAGIRIDSDGDGDDELAADPAERIAQNRPDEDQLSVFRDFINTLDLDDPEK
jgi:hypothetical protein